MQFIASLFCRHGLDNSIRFLAVTVFSLLISLALISSGANLFASIVISLFAITLTTLTSVRRVNDANLQVKLALPSTLLTLISLVLIITIDSHLAFWSVLFPLSYAILLSTYKSKDKQPKILGYRGPVDLSEFTNSRKVAPNYRVEPSFDGASTSVEPMTSALAAREPQPNNEARSSMDFSFVTDLVVNKKKTILIATLSVVTLIIVFSFLISGENNDPIIEETQQVTTPETVEPVSDLRNNLIELPDDYQLMTTEHGGLIITWQADITDEKTLWSQTTANGDKTCESISFNAKTKVRTLQVIVENEEDYVAYFSPLDTKSLVTNIAKRSKFKLCDYEFSLKGSQAVLNKNKFYRELL